MAYDQYVYVKNNVPLWRFSEERQKNEHKSRRPAVLLFQHLGNTLSRADMITGEDFKRFEGADRWYTPSWKKESVVDKSLMDYDKPDLVYYASDAARRSRHYLEVSGKKLGDLKYVDDRGEGIHSLFRKIKYLGVGANRYLEAVVYGDGEAIVLIPGACLAAGAMTWHTNGYKGVNTRWGNTPSHPNFREPKHGCYVIQKFCQAYDKDNQRKILPDLFIHVPRKYHIQYNVTQTGRKRIYTLSHQGQPFRGKVSQKELNKVIEEIFGDR